MDYSLSPAFLSTTPASYTGPQTPNLTLEALLCGKIFVFF